ncbi:MAG: hypothetical protein M1358_00255 [Chloroflexi bacterium]|nr:hypothetical protein [Chloroflexota bacterium]
MPKKITLPLVIAISVVSACQQSPAATSTPIPSATATRPAQVQIATPSSVATAPPKPVATSVQPATPTAAGFSQQYEITEKDSGKTFVYPLTSRFQVILDQQKYPKESFKVDCNPEGALGGISNIPPVSPPLYVLRYEGVKPGKCTLTDGSFGINVEITGSR